MAMDALRASGRNASLLLPASVNFRRNGIFACSRRAVSGTGVEIPASPA